MEINYKQSTIKIAIDLIKKCYKGNLFFGDIERLEVDKVTYLPEGTLNTETVFYLAETRYKHIPNESPVNYTFRYDRVNIFAISGILRGVVDIPFSNQRCTHDFITRVNKLLGLELSNDDVVCYHYPYRYTKDGHPVYRFEMSDKNPAFYGSLDIVIIDHPVRVLKEKVYADYQSCEKIYKLPASGFRTEFTGKIDEAIKQGYLSRKQKRFHFTDVIILTHSESGDRQYTLFYRL